jgi:hypothetical protein
MHFDCRFGNAQVTSNLFIQLAGDDMFEHFAKVNVKVALEPALIVRWAVVPNSELVLSEPPPVDVL